MNPAAKRKFSQSAYSLGNLLIKVHTRQNAYSLGNPKFSGWMPIPMEKTTPGIGNKVFKIEVRSELFLSFPTSFHFSTALNNCDLFEI